MNCNICTGKQGAFRIDCINFYYTFHEIITRLYHVRNIARLFWYHRSQIGTYQVPVACVDHIWSKLTKNTHCWLHMFSIKCGWLSRFRITFFGQMTSFIVVDVMQRDLAALRVMIFNDQGWYICRLCNQIWTRFWFYFFFLCFTISTVLTYSPVWLCQCQWSNPKTYG